MKRPGQQQRAGISAEVHALRSVMYGEWPPCPKCGMECVFSWLNFESVSGATDEQMREMLHSDHQGFCDRLALPPVFVCDQCEETEIPIPWPGTSLAQGSADKKTQPKSESSGVRYGFCPHCGVKLPE